MIISLWKLQPKILKPIAWRATTHYWLLSSCFKASKIIWLAVACFPFQRLLLKVFYRICAICCASLYLLLLEGGEDDSTFCASVFEGKTSVSKFMAFGFIRLSNSAVSVHMTEGDVYSDKGYDTIVFHLFTKK